MLLNEFSTRFALFQKHFNEFTTFIDFIERLVDEFLTQTSLFYLETNCCFFDVFVVV